MIPGCDAAQLILTWISKQSFQCVEVQLKTINKKHYILDISHTYIYDIQNYKDI